LILHRFFSLIPIFFFFFFNSSPFFSSPPLLRHGNGGGGPPNHRRRHLDLSPLSLLDGIPQAAVSDEPSGDMKNRSETNLFAKNLKKLYYFFLLRSRKVKTGTRSPEIVSGEAGVAMAEGLVLC
ncbi:hypothetical protein LINGRAHAP2_LOCUS23261, partial [Linum grandiflorum]